MPMATPAAKPEPQCVQLIGASSVSKSHTVRSSVPADVLVVLVMSDLPLVAVDVQRRPRRGAGFQVIAAAAAPTAMPTTSPPTQLFQPGASSVSSSSIYKSDRKSTRLHSSH